MASTVHTSAISSISSRAIIPRGVSGPTSLHTSMAAVGIPVSSRTFQLAACSPVMSFGLQYPMRLAPRRSGSPAARGGLVQRAAYIPALTPSMIPLLQRQHPHAAVSHASFLNPSGPWNAYATISQTRRHAQFRPPARQSVLSNATPRRRSRAPASEETSSESNTLEATAGTEALPTDKESDAAAPAAPAARKKRAAKQTHSMTDASSSDKVAAVSTSSKSAPPAAADADVGSAPAPVKARRASSKKATNTEPAAAAAAQGTGDAAALESTKPKATRKPRTTKKTSADADASNAQAGTPGAGATGETGGSSTAVPAAAKPKRTRAKKADPATSGATADEAAAAAAAAPKRKGRPSKGASGGSASVAPAQHPKALVQDLQFVRGPFLPRAAAVLLKTMRLQGLHTAEQLLAWRTPDGTAKETVATITTNALALHHQGFLSGVEMLAMFHIALQEEAQGPGDCLLSTMHGAIDDIYVPPPHGGVSKSSMGATAANMKRMQAALEARLGPSAVAAAAAVHPRLNELRCELMLQDASANTAVGGDLAALSADPQGSMRRSAAALLETSSLTRLLAYQRGASVDDLRGAGQVASTSSSPAPRSVKRERVLQALIDGLKVGVVLQRERLLEDFMLGGKGGPNGPCPHLTYNELRGHMLDYMQQTEMIDQVHYWYDSMYAYLKRTLKATPADADRMKAQEAWWSSVGGVAPGLKAPEPKEITMLQIRLAYHLIRNEQQAPVWLALQRHCAQYPMLGLRTGGRQREPALSEEMFL